MCLIDVASSPTPTRVGAAIKTVPLGPTWRPPRSLQLQQQQVEYRPSNLVSAAVNGLAYVGLWIVVDDSADSYNVWQSKWKYLSS